MPIRKLREHARVFLRPFGIIFRLLRQTLLGYEIMTSEVRQQDKVLRSAECQGQKEVKSKLFAVAQGSLGLRIGLASGGTWPPKLAPWRFMHQPRLAREQCPFCLALETPSLFEVVELDKSKEEERRKAVNQLGRMGSKVFSSAMQCRHLPRALVKRHPEI